MSLEWCSVTATRARGWPQGYLNGSFSNPIFAVLSIEFLLFKSHGEHVLDLQQLWERFSELKSPLAVEKRPQAGRATFQGLCSQYNASITSVEMIGAFIPWQALLLSSLTLPALCGKLFTTYSDHLMTEIECFVKGRQKLQASYQQILNLWTMKCVNLLVFW